MIARPYISTSDLHRAHPTLVQLIGASVLTFSNLFGSERSRLGWIDSMDGRSAQTADGAPRVCAGSSVRLCT